MVGENKGKSDGANVAPGLLAENGRTVKKLKGHLVEDKDGDTNLDGSSDVVSRTYKRRKRTEVVEDGLVVGHSAGQKFALLYMRGAHVKLLEKGNGGGGSCVTP
ncbi:hypothetical protein KY284_020920 [Solanum tuberosum]|nr:hypothetical protein KY284_020920 [Solanum tuberosum]